MNRGVLFFAAVALTSSFGTHTTRADSENSYLLNLCEIYARFGGAPANKNQVLESASVQAVARAKNEGCTQALGSQEVRAHVQSLYIVELSEFAESRALAESSVSRTGCAVSTTVEVVLNYFSALTPSNRWSNRLVLKLHRSGWYFKNVQGRDILVLQRGKYPLSAHEVIHPEARCSWAQGQSGL